MKLTTLVFGFILSLSVFPAMAGSDHGHSHSPAPVSKAQAQKNATELVTAYADEAKLEKSWASIEARDRKSTV